MRARLLEKGAIFAGHIFQWHRTTGRGLFPAGPGKLKALGQTVPLKFGPPEVPVVLLK